MTTQAFSLRLEVVPSRLWLFWRLGAHSVACVSLLLLELSFGWLLTGWLVIATHAAVSWYSSRWLPLVRQLRYSNGQFFLTLVHQDEQKISGEAYLVTPWLVILKLRLGARSHFMPLFPDSVDADELRRLRVLLRCRSSLS